MQRKGGYGRGRGIGGVRRRRRIATNGSARNGLFLRLLDAGEAVGFRMMAAAGVLPDEIVLKKQVEAVRAELAAETDEMARRALMARLSELMMKQAIAEESRRKFLKG